MIKLRLEKESVFYNSFDPSGVRIDNDVYDYMFFAMSVGNMVQAKQIHHKLRDLMYEGLGL